MRHRPINATLSMLGSQILAPRRVDADAEQRRRRPLHGFVRLVCSRRMDLFLHTRKRRPPLQCRIIRSGKGWECSGPKSQIGCGAPLRFSYPFLVGNGRGVSPYATLIPRRKRPNLSVCIVVDCPPKKDPVRAQEKSLCRLVSVFARPLRTEPTENLAPSHPF